ncbi:universal stress protein [Nocardia jiangsuensis]|uniref:Universal stress protein n=1 Tax=Nocardia jiangsuensis TaxID=1691563 RepID=A0ABV8DNP0_9NOCA
MTPATGQPVVVGVDGGSPALTAVRWAAAEALRRHAPLELVYAFGVGWDLGPRLGVFSLHNRTHVDEGRAALSAAETTALAVAGSHRLDIRTALLAPHPVSALERRSAAARLLVVGTRGMDAVERGLLGSVSTALAKRARCPMVVVPEARSSDPRLPVLVGVDGSRCAAAAVALAFEYASARNTGVTAVLAWWRDRSASGATSSEDAQLLLAQNLAGYAASHPDVPVTRIVVECDDPGAVLRREAGNAQLLVVGRRGRRGPSAALALGSVSQSVLHQCGLPVLIAPEPRRPAAARRWCGRGG